MMMVIMSDVQLKWLEQGNDFYAYESLECVMIKGLQSPVAYVSLPEDVHIVDSWDGRLHIQGFTIVGLLMCERIPEEQLKFVRNLWKTRHTKEVTDNDMDDVLPKVVK